MRHLDYPEGTAPSDLGDAALDDLLDLERLAADELADARLDAV